MKRKLLLVITIISLSISCCFATVEEVSVPAEPLNPAYVGIIDSQAGISINENTAVYNAMITPKSKDSVSKVVMTLKLVDSKGTVMQTKTSTLLLLGGYFKMSNTKTLTTKGTYHVEYTANIYKGIKLIETVSGKSLGKTY